MFDARTHEIAERGIERAEGNQRPVENKWKPT